MSQAELGAGVEDGKMQALREKLALLQQIQTLQGQVGLAPPQQQQQQQQTAVPKNVKVPEGRYNMSLAEFRTFAKDCTDYKTLTRLTDHQIVLQMRLSMDNDLKLAIDTNYPNYNTLTVEDAIKTIGMIVNQISNTAVHRKVFHDMKQGAEEKMREYATRLRSCAADCAFICPFDESHDLTDYHIIERVRSGVRDDRLQQELLQKQSNLNDVQLIIQYCEDYESAIRDKDILKGTSSSSICAVTTNSELECVSQDEIIAALSLYRRTKKDQAAGKGGGNSSKDGICGCCGEEHPQSKCRALGVMCFKCGKLNHIAKVCRSHPSKKDNRISASILIATVYRKKDSLARLFLLVGAGFVDIPQHLETIPDTGAEVTVAGEVHLITLKIKVKHLIPPTANLQHVAGGRIDVIGCCYLSFTSNDRSIVEKVYFITGVQHIFLSLSALKRFGIVHKNFPHPMESSSYNQPPIEKVFALTHSETVEDSVAEHGNKTQATMAKGGPLQAAPPTAGGKVKGGLLQAAPPTAGGKVKGGPLLAAPPTAGGNTTVSKVEIPFPPVENNIPRLREWLVSEFKGDVFHDNRIPFPHMKGRDQHIHLIDPNATPYAVHVPSPVPFHLEGAVNELLSNWVAKGIITPVAVGEECDYCSRMVVCTKKDGRPRLTVDFQELNKNIKRETHHSPRPYDAICGIPACSFKTVLDATDGYSQIKLDEESSKLTTFITTLGRFRFLRAPQGLRSSGDAYTRRFDEVLVDIINKVKIIDDSLLYDGSIEESFHHAYRFLLTCRQNDVTLNEKKFVFCQKELEFAGFKLGWGSYTTSDDMLSAIASFPMPDRPTLSDIRAWFGLVNQLSPFFATCQIMQPFLELLQSGTKTVYWDNTLQQVFEQSKKKIIEEAIRGLKYFNVTDSLCLQTDWSKTGIGFVLLQQSCSCKSISPGCCSGGWQLVFCNSRFLQPSEANYCPLEGEALAVAWSLKKGAMFLLGCPKFLIQTDHKPLVPILGDKALSTIDNPRVLRFKEKTLPFSFHIQHLEGSSMITADVLSRYPVGQPDAEDVEFARDAEMACIKIAASIIRAIDVFAATEAGINYSWMQSKAIRLLHQSQQKRNCLKTSTK